GLDHGADGQQPHLDRRAPRRPGLGLARVPRPARGGIGRGDSTNARTGWRCTSQVRWHSPVALFRSRISAPSATGRQALASYLGEDIPAAARLVSIGGDGARDLRRPDMPQRQDVSAAEEEIDRLYGLPLDEFTRDRDALARRIRQEGEGTLAAEIKQLRKPTLPAWVVN